MGEGWKLEPAGKVGVGGAWLALTGHPARFLRSSWPWRSTVYLLSGGIVALPWALATVALAFLPAVGPLALLAGVPLAVVERWRLRLVDPAPLRSPHHPPAQPGVWAWLGTRFREPSTWMELAYGLLFALALAWVDLLVAVTAITVTAALVAAPLLVHYHAAADGQPIAFFGYAVSSVREAVVVTVAGVLLLPVVAYLLTAFAAARAALTRTVLAWRGREELDAKVLELSRSRARILQASDAQRRRIERDLHDGAQQRLTGLIMTLGLARLELADAPPEARSLVDKAHEESKRVLAELRDLVHGVHPQVLTDRGLAPALAGLVERCPVPVELDVDLPERPPEPVEAAAWFIVSEALANVAKHSGARRAWVLARRVGQLLVLEVRDDGVGGADPAPGGGLVGLADRVSVLDGRMHLVSPPGGPTVLRGELPCGW